MLGFLALCACGGNSADMDAPYYATPTVDYIETLDVHTAQHNDSFLSQLAMNYRSYAIFNARTSGHPDIGERFAQKAVAAFSGETPFPETVDSWSIRDSELKMDLAAANSALIEALKNDSAETDPELAAEAQAKFDCWISAAASEQWGTAEECNIRFDKALSAIYENLGGTATHRIAPNGNQQTVSTITEEITETTVTKTPAKQQRTTRAYYPETSSMRAMTDTRREREGVVIVNNVNIPKNLIQPQPVPQNAQPIVFNQNIVHHGNKAPVVVTEECNHGNCETSADPAPVTEVKTEKIITEKIIEKPCPELPAACKSCSEPAGTCDKSCRELSSMCDEMVSRDEFIRMMTALRQELSAINKRMDDFSVQGQDKTILKVQQIPLEPRQHVMEEIFEVRFDFDKANIKPEYEDIIKKLVDTTRANRNVKVTVVGHTDTMGSVDYNYALGGRRAESVRSMLIRYGIPAEQIVSVSSGKADPKVPTGDQVRNEDNRRVRVVKETHSIEPATVVPGKTVAIKKTETIGRFGERSAAEIDVVEY